MIDKIVTAITHPLLITVALALIAAQGSKLFTHYRHGKKLDFSLILSTGGMPSTHSSIVTALCVGVFLWDGPTSLFVVTVVVAGIVIRDALGVRWLAGMHSIAINKIIKSLKKERTIHIENVRELLGHTPLQVYVGCALGFFIALAYYGVMSWI